jgi:hypothetical protein
MEMNKTIDPQELDFEISRLFHLLSSLKVLSEVEYIKVDGTPISIMPN